MIRCSFHYVFCILNAFASILYALCKAMGTGFMGDSRDLKRQFCPSTLCQDAAHVV